MAAKKELMRKLKKYFERRDDIVMAFLFGSRAKKRTHGHSDWDIAVYFRPATRKVEWEEHKRGYPAEDQMWGDLVDILKTDDVDLLVLNRASASIADAAIRGIPLVVKDRDLWLEFMLIVTREADDYRSFVSDYYDIYQRSSSLLPRDQKYLKNAIIFLEAELGRYSYFANLSLSEYENDVSKRNDIERWIEKIINASIDISKIILGSEKKIIPETYRDAVAKAARLLGLPEDFVEEFEHWVKLRNILAHEYLDIKWRKISDFAKTSEPYFRAFIDAAKKFLNEP